MPPPAPCTASPLRCTASRRRLLGWVAGAALAHCALAAGEAPPEGPAAASPLRLIVPYPAGGPADLVARQIEPTLRRVLKAPLVVLNIPGAGGGLGVQRLLTEPAEGLPLLVGTPSDTIVAPLLNPVLGYRPEQLRLVGVISWVPVALVGGKHLPQTALAALLRARRQPGAAPLSYGSFGVGSQAHLVSEDLGARLALPLLHIPYAGVPALLQDLVAGRIDLAFLPLAGAVREAVSDGRLRVYGLAAAAPDARHPGVPTLDEAAGLSGFHHPLWVGLFAPATLTEAALAPARAGLHAVLAEPAFQQLKAGDGSVAAAPMSAAQADRYFEAQRGHYRGLVEAVKPAVR